MVISKCSPVLLLLLTLFLSSAFLSLAARNPDSPRSRYQECQQQCQEEEQGQRQQQHCQQRCEKQYEQEKQSEEKSHHHGGNPQPQEQKNNPFFFHSRTFQSRFRSEHGSFSVLPRFSQQSRLLRGIENYRFVMIEAHPNTFVLPHHCDSEAVFVVLNGQGTLTLVNDERRQSFNLKRGNVIRVPAGTVVYLVNPESNDKLAIASLEEPVNAPGKFDEFFLAGGENPQSYFNIFSDEVLESVLNTPRDQLRRLFEEQKEQGFIRKASREQLRALSKESSSSPRHRESESSPRHREESESQSSSPIDLLNQHPLYSNQNGVFHEACPDEFKQLRNMDVAIGALEMKQGSIFVPHYHTRQTTLVLITEGRGQFEMASPQQSEQSRQEQSERQEEEEEEEEKRSGELRKITARANPGDIFVIPAAHPVAIIASNNENLRGFTFGFNAENDERIFLAGRNNVVKNMEREAQELSFGVPAQQVQKVFGNQEESYFVSARRQRQQRGEGRGDKYLSSILDVGRLF